MWRPRAQSAHIALIVGTYWTGCSCWFFLYNGPATILEDSVTPVGKRLGVKENWAVKLLGYTWTLAWFTYATPWLVDWLMEAGLGRHQVFSRSLVVKPVFGYIAQTTGVDVLQWVAQKCALYL